MLLMNSKVAQTTEKYILSLFINVHSFLLQM